MIHNVSQDENPSVEEPDEQDRSFDAARAKYINLNSVKSVIFTKLESSTNQS